MEKILAICISEKKGLQKHEVQEAELVEGKGILGDAHFGAGHRQISLLSEKQIDKMRDKVDIFNGIFAENIVYSGDFEDIKVGDTIKIDDTILEVTQLGKTCHHDCEVYKKAGMCIMPTYGIFCKVVKGGKIKKNSNISIERK